MESHPHPIKAIQAVIGRKTKGRRELQSQLPVYIIFYYYFVVTFLTS